ncbi:MAG TPA: DinB family protein [Cyclobacteriaceae bacterium]|nr:DinB family protein [Cyclobacteriaceae bacterium]
MKEYYINLFEYNYWANSRIILLLQKEKVRDEKILTLMGHTLAADITWLSRIKPLDGAYGLWRKYTIEELVEMQDFASKHWLDYIRSSNSLEESIQYKNTKGDVYVSRISNILTHVVNHATYHRGQIALLLRQNGFTPVDTDYIIYERTVTKQI